MHLLSTYRHLAQLALSNLHSFTATSHSSDHTASQAILPSFALPCPCITRPVTSHSPSSKQFPLHFSTSRRVKGNERQNPSLPWHNALIHHPHHLERRSKLGGNNLQPHSGSRRLIQSGSSVRCTHLFPSMCILNIVSFRGVVSSVWRSASG